MQSGPVGVGCLGEIDGQSQAGQAVGRSRRFGVADLFVKHFRSPPLQFMDVAEAQIEKVAHSWQIEPGNAVEGRSNGLDIDLLFRSAGGAGGWDVVRDHRLRMSRLPGRRAAGDRFPGGFDFRWLPEGVLVGDMKNRPLVPAPWWLTLLGIGILLALAACSGRQPPVLLKPSKDLALARPAGTGPSPVSRLPAPVPPAETGPKILLETNLGNITLVLDPDKAPITVANFLEYAKSGFYDNTIFHRVIPGFMIQGGGYTVNREEKPTSAPIRNESTNGLRNRRGSVAMARREPLDSATAQFFVNLTDNDFLDADGPYGGYAVFGRVLSGMETVDKIAETETESVSSFENLPKNPVIIRRVALLNP